jgi:hypothetical protein
MLTKGVKPANMAKHKAKLIWRGSLSEFKIFRTLANVRIIVTPPSVHWGKFIPAIPLELLGYCREERKHISTFTK